MAESLLQDAHSTFVSCFHAFYPSGPLKWVCLCSQLSSMDERSSDRLLAATIDSLCNPTIKLRTTFPIGLGCEGEPKTGSPVENISGTGSMAGGLGEMGGAGARFPILAEVMSYHSHTETAKFGSWNFTDVLHRLLLIVNTPISEALRGEKVSYSQDLVTKTCRLISCVVSELSSLKGGPEAGLASIANRVALVTPNRFTRTSNSRTWNTGNGSPDAICFTVDRAGILVAGAAVYGGAGNFEYELELLQDQSGGEQRENGQQSQRWISLEHTAGTYSSEDCGNDIAVIKFEKPVGAAAGTKYALRLRNHGARTNNGDGGQSSVRGTDGTCFTFHSCSLSFNGTNPTRGQIPQILYYSSPSEEPATSCSSASLAHSFSRQSALSITVTVVRAAAGLLVQASQPQDGPGLETLNSAPVITSLLPHIMASVAGMASTDPAAAVRVLALVQDLLPSVAKLNQQAASQAAGPELPAPHYAWVQSDHPYRPAGLFNYKVMFPASVRWMAVEFDPACRTRQQEDSLQLYIRNPASQRPRNLQPSPLTLSHNSDPVLSQAYSPVLGKFSGKTGWPSHGVVLPGNEALFSLETASDYVKGDSKSSSYGFKCLVTGYECGEGGGDGLKNLEHELAYLGGLCAASLMSKAIQLPAVGGTEGGGQGGGAGGGAQQAAQELYDKFPGLLKKGFAVEHLPSIQQALAGYIPFNCQSSERLFLRDLVDCSPGTAGGRLAAWLQPDSYISTQNCGVLFEPEELRCSWPAIITVVTRDQYGATAHVPNMKVEVKAVPIDELNSSLGSGSLARSRKPTQPDSLTFGGHPPPNLDTKYEVTVKDKMFYHAITVSKAYDDYSFEELRYASPKLQRQSENMLVRPNGDGTYSANWTPANVGWYRLLVCLDGCELPTSQRVEVLDPPQGKPPPSPSQLVRPAGESHSKLRQFVSRPSAGLRIRLHPTLQSEQVGIVPVEGTLSITDEVSNTDGVWVRLSSSSLAEYCGPASTEGWALQYNKHYDKILLRQVVEPLPSKPKESFKRPSAGLPSVFSSDQSSDKKKCVGARRVPGTYTVVKCGASGHNVRCAPSLYAAPVGKLSLGDAIMVCEVKELGSGECWVRLDKETADKFSFAAADGDVWSLAVTATDNHYLESEAEIQEQRWPELPVPVPGFDRLEPGAAANSPFGLGWGVAGGATGFSSGSDPAAAAALARRKSLPRPARPATPPRQPGGPQSLGAVSKTVGPQLGRGRAGSTERKSFFQKWFKGDEPVRRPSTPGSPATSRKASPADPHRKSIQFNKDLPPELQGVSVKELVKVIGASRANGNGVTPPGTPGPARKSRSASPAVAGVAGAFAFSRSRSSSPISVGHGRGLAGSSAPESPGLARQNSSQSDSSALLSSLTRDLSGLSSSLSRQDGSVSPVSLKSDQLRCGSPGSRHSSPRRPQPDQNPGLLPVSSMEVSQDSLREAAEPPNLTTAPPPATVAVKPRPPERPRPTVTRAQTETVTPGPVVEAMSPSVAESIRAVFAAFIWHSGLAQDAMACAAYLKFNSGLTKQGSGAASNEKTGRNRENKAKQRHSVEVISTAYLNYKDIDLMDKSAVNANANRNVQRYLSDASGGVSDVIPEDGESKEPSPEVSAVPGLPVTLGQLVLLWEGIVLNCLDTIVEQSSLNAWNKDKMKQSSSNNIRSRNQSNNSHWREKDGWPGKKSKEQSDRICQICDICGGYFEHPVTYHMRSCHPGCGGHAGGKGYNSGGQYCGGWAGNCGDGGLGGSSWYLICEACKEKHSKENGAKVGKLKPFVDIALAGKNESEKGSKSGLAGLPLSAMVASFSRAAASSPAGQLDTHMVMKANSMFLLDLACSSGEEAGRRRAVSTGPASLPTVAELPPHQPAAFPYSQFHCLEALGVQDSQLRELDAELARLQADPSATGWQSPAPTEGKEIGSRREPSPELEPPEQFQEDGAVVRRSKFHRSVSIGSPRGKEWSPAVAGSSVLTNRKRNSSYEEAGEREVSSAELLSRTSAAWRKLFSGGGQLSGQLLHSTLLSFLLQWNDLESLQVAMQLSLRKAVCRAYSMQVLR